MKNHTNRVGNERPIELGTWIALGNTIVTELASSFDFDWLLFDLEHGCFQPESILPNLQVTKKDIQVIVRINSVDPGFIARVLDWGAAGLMLPHVSDAGQVVECLKAMSYPPIGKRGYSSSARIFDYGLTKPKDVGAISRPKLIAQIEDLEGVKNAEKIAQVEGVDTLFVGPSDLSLALSIANDPQALTYEDCLEIVAEAALKHGKHAGILLGDMGQIEKYRGLGYTRLAVSSDMSILRNGFQSMQL